MKNTPTSPKMFLTNAEAKAAGLPSVAQQIERHNQLMTEIHRANADKMLEWIAAQVASGKGGR